MVKIEWREEYSVGNAEIDQEHESLIAQVNLLFYQISLPMDTVAIETMLSEIQVDFSAHFALEELLMQETGFSEYEAHQQDHERVLDQINDLIFHFSEDPDGGKELLIIRFSDWFSNHFRGFDARLHSLPD